MKFHFRFLITLLIVLTLLLAVAPSFAQDLSTNTPDVIEGTATALASTPVATEEPTAVPTPIPNPPDEPSPFETILANVNWTIIILAVALAFFGFLAYVVKIIGASAPAALWEGGKATVRATYGDIDKLVEGTPDKIDDALWQAVRGQIEQLIKSVDEQRTAGADKTADPSTWTQPPGDVG